jgi:hypothetical protein
MNCADHQNDIPSGLERYLAPTDCRLRTDQRAFENAEYDRAQAYAISTGLYIGHADAYQTKNRKRREAT